MTITNYTLTYFEFSATMFAQTEYYTCQDH